MKTFYDSNIRETPLVKTAVTKEEEEEEEQQQQQQIKVNVCVDGPKCTNEILSCLLLDTDNSEVTSIT